MPVFIVASMRMTGPAGFILGMVTTLAFGYLLRRRLAGQAAYRLVLIKRRLPYMLDLANYGWREACRRDHALALDLNTHAGEITYKAVADAFDLPSVSLDSVLA